MNADGGGLFGVVGGSVSRFGLSEMDIRGRDVGGLAATVTGLVSLVWGTGRVGVDESDGGGGLAAAVAGGDVRESWFVGEINGGVGIGGLVGRLSGGVGAQVGDSWAMARVSDVDGGNESGVGGLIGWSEGDAILRDSWSGSEMRADEGAGGLVGRNAGASNAVGGDESYFDFSISQFDASRFDDVLRGFDVTAFGVETMTTVSVMSWSGSIWNFGDSEIGESDKSADYPFLLGSEDLWPGRQAVAFADFQTRLLRGGEPFAAGERSFLAMGESMRLILDTNGIAPGAPTPAPTCGPDSQGARVKTNYNGVTILLRTTAGGTMSLSPDCELIVGYRIGSLREFDLLVTVAAGNSAVSRVYGFAGLGGEGDDFWLADSDGDGLINAYDWTPFLVNGRPIDLLRGANGSAAKPWPIYNIRQLQAIDGVGIAPNGEAVENFPLFGLTERERLRGHYRLMNDIDATPTRRWRNRSGFSPLGGDLGNLGGVELMQFQGSFDGGGHEIRGLFVNTNSGDAGLFGAIGGDGEVERLQLSDIDIRSGFTFAGALAASSFGRVSQVGAAGVVSGGALVGGLLGGGGGDVSDSWFVGEVKGSRDIGGLVGDAQDIDMRNNWSAARVVNAALFGGLSQGYGGLIGNPRGRQLVNSWSSGEFDVSSDLFAGGLLGVSNDNLSMDGDGNYWDVAASGINVFAHGDQAPRGSFAVEALGVETMATVINDFWDPIKGWRFGDTDDSIGGADYPFLRAYDNLRPNAQAVAYAAEKARLTGGDGAEIEEFSVMLAGGRVNFRLDTNGRAADRAPAPTCVVDDEGARAETNYNGVTIFLRATAGGVLSLLSADCDFSLDLTDRFGANVALLLNVAAGKESKTVAYQFLLLSGVDEEFWLSDQDDDGIISAYDWTPIEINGRGIDLRFGADGSAGNPWPIYNIWHLQAIEGRSVSIDGVMTAGDGRFGEVTLFGDSDSERLAANYRLALNIEATVTRKWDDGRGFNPIGAGSTDGFSGVGFSGVFDGEGRVVRGLRINRPGEDFVGLFAFASSTADNRTPTRVIDFGLDDARIAGGNAVGAIAGRWGRADLRSVWARGRVTGKEKVGGLVGENVGGTDVSSSWFAGQVAGDNAVGGLAGTLSFARLEDSWAAVDIDAPIGAGELAGRVGGLSFLSRLWGEGFSPTSASQNDDALSIYYDNIRSLDDADLGGAWTVGTDDDFPVLADRLRGLQGAAVAFGLTRVAGVGNDANAPLPLDFSDLALPLDFTVMRLTPNTDEIDAFVCEFADGALRAATGFNGATVMMTVMADDWRLASRGGCDVEWVGSSAQGVMTLRLLFAAGAGAEKAILTTDYRIDIAETLARMALDRFIQEINADGFNWFQPVSDWDGDGVLNPYDWTPTSVTVLGMTVGVNLTLGGANGEADSPWPIYNIWQLQAIDGISVSSEGDVGGEIELFGSEDRDRLGAHYRLALDIDAAPTRIWGANKEGFNPIGGNLDFAGGFDGGGYAVRGLFINRSRTSDVGLFSGIDSLHEITNLGVEEADILGGTRVGILAGHLLSDVGKIWTTGKVAGNLQVNFGDNIGGLAGSSSANAHDSWSTADVRGGIGVGGLIGRVSGEATVTLSDSWAAGDVVAARAVDTVYAGGFGGIVAGNNLVLASFARNWSAGAVAGGAFANGFLGEVFNDDDNIGAASVSLSYWNADTSGVADLLVPAAVYGESVLLQTLGATNFGDDDSWDVGGDDDFPLLAALDRPRQAVYLARALTRILALRIGLMVTADERSVARIDSRSTLRLDTNGLAADEGADGTSIPTCSFADGVLRAETNYNGVTMELRLLAEEAALIAAADDCEATIESVADEFAATLRLEIAAAAIGGDRARRLTTDYPLAIAPMLEPDALAVFLAEIASGKRKWLGGDSDDWDRDGVVNPYDWTPTSVIVSGATVSVNLTLGLIGEGGTESNPWPIYNIWQLQAIDGESVAIDGVVSDSDSDNAASTLFGDSDAERLGAHYRLMADIDASPTRDWARTNNSGGRTNLALGFQPLGWSNSIFQGSFDGQGREIRNLFMRRGVIARFGNDFGINAGLFAVVGASATVRNLGLRDLDFRSDEGRFVGGLAGKVSVGLVSLVWATGVVEGESMVGGLAGLLEGGGEIVDSWFVGKVEGIENTGGGLVGASETGRIRDSWALAELSRGESSVNPNPIGGLIGRNRIDGVLDNSWAIGLPPAEEGAGLIGDNQAQVSVRQAYWDQSSSTVTIVGGDMPASVFSVETMVTVTNIAWSTTAWDFGGTVAGDNSTADYPFLRGSEGFWPGRQALAFADFQTRLVADSGETLAMDGERITMRLDATLALRLDTNGLAANDPGDADSTPTPSCGKDGEGVQAETNYNNVTIWLQATGGGTLALSPSSNCVVEFTYPLAGGNPSGPVSLLLSITSAESSLSRAHAVLASPFSEGLPTRVFAPFDAVGETALLTVSLSFGELKPFTVALRDNASVVVEEAGRFAVLLLRAPSATALFARDNESFIVTLSAFIERTDFTEAQVIELKSSPRPIDGETLTIALGESEAAAGAFILAAGAASISIWHNDDETESWTLSQSGDDFGVDPRTGLVTAAANLERRNYELTLRLMDAEVTATRPLLVSVFEDNLERLALNYFIDQVRAGEIDWTVDSDGDGIRNAYDLTPVSVEIGGGFVTVNLTLGADGTAERPWPIYNVWHLQAIDDVSVSADGDVDVSEIFDLYDGADGVRVKQHYRLLADIDATPTRRWGTTGFSPIGEREFAGSLFGDGWEIRGLWIRSSDGFVGLFESLGASATVSRLGLPDLDVEGRQFVAGDQFFAGGLAGNSRGRISQVWATGRVVGEEAGGLLGQSLGNDMEESWFVGEVAGSSGAAGLVARMIAVNPIRLRNVWAATRVSVVGEGLGGLMAAVARGVRIDNGWAGGEVFGAGSSEDGLNLSSVYVDGSFSNVEEVAPNPGGRSALVVETAATISAVWDATIWKFGDSALGEDDNSADYPILLRSEELWPGEQAVALAGYQTRLLRDGEAPGEALASGDVLILDTNGAASDGPAPAPTCNDNDGVTAETNYNDVTVLLRATEGAAVSLVAGGGCDGVSIGYPDNAADFSVLAILSTREATVTVSRSFAPLLIAGAARPLTVAADAAAGAVATIRARGATKPSFVDVTEGLLRTGGGVSAAVVSLVDPAAEAFFADNMTLTLTLTATDDEGASTTATIRFVSAPRVIESDQPIEIRMPRREAVAGVTVLLAGESGLDILHNGAAREVYTLSQSGDAFGVDPSLGEVTTTRELDTGEYRLTLLLTHEGVTARRELRVVVLSLEEEALAAFVADIAADRIDWLGGDIDWDDDGVLNPYDWTPTSVLIDGDFIGVNLTLAGASGEAGSPWPIYNVWQLQAIDGMSVSVDNKARGGFTLFGDSQGVRLSAHYRLTVNIDATPTRDWGDKGFAPIGGEHSNQSNTIEAFTGGFDGGGYAVRGLFINRPSSNFVGLFSAIENPRKMIDLGVEEADIRGQSDVGILAGSLHSSRMQSDPFRIDVRRIWTTGKVAGTRGHPPNRNSRRVGGLVGNMGGLSAISFIDLRDSWSTADVRASNVVGGLIGEISRSGTVTVSNSWAAGNVAAMNSVGGFGGFVTGNSWLTRNWSAGGGCGRQFGRLFGQRQRDECYA